MFYSEKTFMTIIIDYTVAVVYTMHFISDLSWKRLKAIEDWKTHSKQGYVVHIIVEVAK